MLNSIMKMTLIDSILTFRIRLETPFYGQICHTTSFQSKKLKSFFPLHDMILKH